jgi:D-glycero-D-manno-heptose 1,7-bisphosphate phosphatase
MSARLVILDRDGVLNHESPEYIKSPAEWRPITGSLEAVARLHAAGWRVALATNQSGIARGLMTEADFQAIQRHIDARLAEMGARLELVLHSPAGPDSNSPMRKPRPGMLLEIARRLDVSLADVPFVGDSARDIEAARAAGARPVLVRTGHGEQTLQAAATDLADVPVYADLAAFVDDWLATPADGEAS